MTSRRDYYFPNTEPLAGDEMRVIALGTGRPFVRRAQANTSWLVELGNEGIARVVHGGDPFSHMWIKTWQRIDDAVIDRGVLSESEVAKMRQAYEDPTFTYRTQLTQSVWGRKPSVN